ncbi:hypothetical protein HY229_05950 [Candidatus Acetothermia bacterium]|nr:hypothetical protein [Candidatus Acetothermia bacterium]MBI3643624.1 hypothetical protein [Candidatus Acetothermia bacterium]
MEEQDKSQWVQQVNQPLYEAKGWIKFLGVLAILTAGLVLAATAFTIPIMLSMMNFGGYSISIMRLIVPIFTMIIYAIIIYLCVRIGILLIQLSGLVEMAPDHSSLELLKESQHKMKEVFVYLGWTASISVFLYVASYLVKTLGLLTENPYLR